jgi:hypothetical protein
MRFPKRAAILVLSAVFVVPVAAQDHPNGWGTVDGTVSAADSGAPLAFARVSGGGRHAITDDKGRFRLCQVAPGSVAIGAVGSLYDSAVVNVTLTPGASVQVSLVLQRDTAFPTSILLRRHSSTRAVRQLMYFLDGERVVIDGSACATPPPGVRLVTELAEEDLDWIQFLPGEEAVALYGPEAADGVVLITTHGRKP